MNDVLDYFGRAVYRSGLGGDSPGPDLRGDQLKMAVGKSI